MLRVFMILTCVVAIGRRAFGKQRSSSLSSASSWNFSISLVLSCPLTHASSRSMRYSSSSSALVSSVAMRLRTRITILFFLDEKSFLVSVSTYSRSCSTVRYRPMLRSRRSSTVASCSAALRRSPASRSRCSLGIAASGSWGSQHAPHTPPPEGAREPLSRSSTKQYV